MLLYPRLPLTVARKVATEYSSQSIEHLLNLSGVNHPTISYSPTGGNRVTESYLQEIYKRMRDTACNYGYPRPVDDLRARGFDASSGQILHEMMDVTPAEASNQGIWAFASCIMWPDIVRWRFPGNTDGTSQDRFIGGRRNTFGRVWWRAYILRQPDKENPYEMLTFLGEDELVQITERPSLAGSSSLVKEICRTFLDITNQSSSGMPRSRLLLRDVMKRLRRLLPMTSFDALDERTLTYVIDEVFKSSIQSLNK